MISKHLKTFSNINILKFKMDGIDEQAIIASYSINPYSADHMNNQDSYFTSYSFVTRGIHEYYTYKAIEMNFIKAFEKIFGEFEIIGIRIKPDSVVYTEYQKFLAFQHDFELSLREDTQLNFLIDELGMVLHGNFDLIMSLYQYLERNDRHDVFMNLLRENNLFINEVKISE
ncbi:MAG TPA: hypothetical protein PLY70_12700 [Saprospiraceae bacterium]|nr:hypothetical protein [Saprospiraceae bacterium]